MRTVIGFGLASLITLATLLPSGRASAQEVAVAQAVSSRYTAEELDNLLAPVALYPDPILAQVLIAASYPDQVELAAEYVERHGRNRLDDQPWDLSVRAVAHYAPVLNLLADRLDWTTALGQAYADQPEDVMQAVQSLRTMARAHGNLVTTKEQQVVVEDRYIRILPAQPQIIYVPAYDPLMVYHRPIVHLGMYRSGWSFGVGFPIGVWLAHDLDWRHRHVYYHGWDVHGYPGVWYHRSRPFITINHIYVSPRPRVVVVNRTVVHRRVDYRRFDRYNYVHRNVTWDRHGRDDGRRYADGRRSWDRDGRNERGGDGWQGERRGDGRGPSWDRDRRNERGDGRGDGRGDRDGRTNRSSAVNRDVGRAERVTAASGAVARMETPRENASRTPQANGSANASRTNASRAAGNATSSRNPSWDRAGRAESGTTTPSRATTSRGTTGATTPSRATTSRTVVPTPQRSAERVPSPSRSPERVQSSRPAPETPVARRAEPRAERAATSIGRSAPSAERSASPSRAPSQPRVSSPPSQPRAQSQPRASSPSQPRAQSQPRASSPSQSRASSPSQPRASSQPSRSASGSEGRAASARSAVSRGGRGN